MNRDYLLTGASGFLGKVINSVLSQTASVSRLAKSGEGEYRVDFSVAVPQFHDTFETVIHAGGKAHTIPSTPEEAREFFAVNYTGTVNLAKGLETLPRLPRHFIFISTVAVYGEDVGEMLTEHHPLTGATPYAASKRQAEEFLQTWCAKNDITLTILRLPLIVAPGAPGNLGAMIRMMKKNLYVGIGPGRARKSMVLATDVAEFMDTVRSVGGVYNLTDGYHPTMAEFENALAVQLGVRKPIRLPDFLLRLLAVCGDLLGNRAPFNSEKFKKLTSTLTFSDAKARTIGWKSKPVLTNLPL